MPVLLIDPSKTNTVRERTEKGSVARTEHWDGSVDASVRLRALRLHMTSGAPPDTRLVAAVAELEAAQREWLVAKHSPDPAWSRFVRRRIEVAKERVREVS